MSHLAIPAGVMPGTDPPTENFNKKTSKTAIRLETSRLTDAAAESERVGEKAGSRNVIGCEALYLETLIRDLKAWANSTEPEMTIAHFATDAMRAGRCRALRRVIADRRTGALRVSLNSAQRRTVAQSFDYNSEDEQGNPDSPRPLRVVHEPKLELSSDNVMPMPVTMGPGLIGPQASAESGEAAQKIESEKPFPSKSMGQSLNTVSFQTRSGSSSARTAPPLDMDLDSSDALRHPPGMSSVCSGYNDDEEMNDYELTILREFEAGVDCVN